MSFFFDTKEVDFMDKLANVIFDSAHATVIHTSGTGIKECRRLESIGRTCYNSADKTTDDSYISFLKNIIKRGHESVLEHGSMTVKFYVNRAIANEIVRHRLASYSQESTRYVDYTNEIHFILPTESAYWTKERVQLFMDSAARQWNAYTELMNTEKGLSKQIARDILPLCTATTLIMSANYREWRHFFKMRCDKAAHPDMQIVAKEVLAEAKGIIPVIFDDLYETYC